MQTSTRTANIVDKESWWIIKQEFPTDDAAGRGVDKNQKEETYRHRRPPIRGANQLVARCMVVFGWDCNYALRVLKAYKQFLELKVAFRDWKGKYLCPPEPVEGMWRQHIVDTSNYIQDCFLLCDGNFLHYDPDNNARGDQAAAVARLRRIEATRAAIRGRFGPDQYDLDIWRAFSSLNLSVPIIPKQEPSHVDQPKEQIVHDVSFRFKRKRQNYTTKETASEGDIDSEPSKFVIDPSMPTSRRRRRYRSVHETNLNYKASRSAKRGGSTATAYVKRLAQGHVAHIPKSDSPTKTTTTTTTATTTTTKGPVKKLSLVVGIQLRPPPYAVGALSVVGIPASTSIGDMIYQIKKKKKIPCATQLVASKNDESLREDETLQSLLDRGILLLNKDDHGGGDDFQLILRLAQKE